MEATVALLEAVGQHAWPVAAMAFVLLLLRTTLVKILYWNIVFHIMRVSPEQRQAIMLQVARKDFGLPPTDRPSGS